VIALATGSRWHRRSPVWNGFPTTWCTSLISLCAGSSPRLQGLRDTFLARARNPSQGEPRNARSQSSEREMCAGYYGMTWCGFRCGVRWPGLVRAWIAVCGRDRRQRAACVTGVATWGGTPRDGGVWQVRQLAGWVAPPAWVLLDSFKRIGLRVWGGELLFAGREGGQMGSNMYRRLL
jgi:hypothetical protein